MHKNVALRLIIIRKEDKDEQDLGLKCSAWKRLWS